MNSLLKTGEFAGLALMLAFLAIILWRIVSGEISLDGLLDSKAAGAAPSYSPERAQLLVFTLFVAGKYLLAVFQNPNRNSLPDLPPEVVAVLAGSQAIYLGGKAWSRFRPLLKKLK